VIASITLETDDDSVRCAITPTSPAVARRLTTMRRLRAAGIFTQIAIAPMFPNDYPRRFADLAAEASDRAIVDTYFDCDGASGRRSRALGIGELYERLRRLVQTRRRV
jgi:DNA repair photolyase